HRREARRIPAHRRHLPRPGGGFDHRILRVRDDRLDREADGLRQLDAAAWPGGGFAHRRGRDLARSGSDLKETAVTDFSLSQGVSALAALLVVHLLVVASPGPAFLAVSRTAISSSRAAGVVAASGMATGALIWAIATLFGLHI